MDTEELKIIASEWMMIGFRTPIECELMGSRLFDAAEEIDRLRAEVAKLDELTDRQSEHISDLAAEVAALRSIESAARNLVAVRGRHHSEIAYQRLVEALNGANSK